MESIDDTKKIKYTDYTISNDRRWRVPRGVVVNVLDSNIVVSEIELQFELLHSFSGGISLEKDVNPFIFQLYRLITKVG